MSLPDDLMSWTISLWRKPSTEVSFTLAIVSPTKPRKESLTENCFDWKTKTLCAVLPRVIVQPKMSILS